jgi:AmmeMemoRadiSam system protein A
MLSQQQQEKLLKIARRSIENVLMDSRAPVVDELDSELREKGAAFVTITKKGKLRGCIGYIEAVKPLYQTVSEMAIQAATADPRFPILDRSELAEVRLEISVLSPLKKITDISEIKVGTHGILIRKGFSSGLLLPQVAVEQKWDRKEFLENTCYKAGLPPDAWGERVEIYIFSAEVFKEKE